MQKFFCPRGTADILPEEIPAWNALEQKARNLLAVYGYKEIRTPLFEETQLFARSMGQTSDVVSKHMLGLKASNEDKPAILAGGGHDPIFSLRPEGTAAVVRSYIENSLDKKESLSKLFYLGPMFRGERPQKGRLRQFHQIGVEAIGPQSASPYLDAEVIALSAHLLTGLGLAASQFKLKINTLGSPEDKENFAKLLRQKLSKKLPDLCEDCRNRFERNVFRILDCKNKNCQAVVAKLETDHSYLSPGSRTYFQNVLKALDSLGVAYEQSSMLVRGLDYYTHTVFEIAGAGLGSQDALGAGGRYNNLVSQLGGPQVDAIGFALGIERILLALGEKAKIAGQPLTAFIISLDENSLAKSFEILNILRQSGIASDMNYRVASMKSQMRSADKSQARYVIILGQNELDKGVVAVKEMSTGTQQEIKFSNKDSKSLVTFLAKG